MKKQSLKRWFSSALAGILLAANLSLPAFAEETESGTIAGDPVTTQVASGGQVSREMNMNEGWKFYLGTSNSAQNTNFDDSGWKSVTLPHDFSISQNFTTGGEAESGFLPGGTGWYRKTFSLPESYAGKTLVLNFDGVYSDAYVYVNGTQVGENHYGYTAFAFDVTDYLTSDGVTENVIAVRAVNNIPSSRWYSGSGIYRDVTLVAADPVHVQQNGTYVTTPDIANGNGTVNVEVDVVNDSEAAAEVTVRSTVYTQGGTQASDAAETTVSVAAGQTVTANVNPSVGSPALWSVDAPNLYSVRTELLVGGAVTDTYDTTFGFRWFGFDSNNGFYLNGQAVKLNGVCLHHDQGALGSAAYDDAMYRQLSIMKDMGVNAIRTSHNPADEDFIDICNELGLLVVEEAFDGWSVDKNGNSNDFSSYFSAPLGSGNQILGGSASMTWAEYAIKSMVLRDRNDPCVILWSLGNEIQEGASAASDFPAIAQNLINWVKEKDTTRPTTIGDNTKAGNSVLQQVLSVIKNNGGVVGFNYADSSTLASLHNTYGPIIASETSSAVNSRGIYSSQANASNADGRYHLTSYDTSRVSWGKTAAASMWDTLTADYVAGEFVWTGFDYIGEPTPWNGTGTGSVSKAGAIPNSSYFGIVETTGFEKDTYYLYRSQWKQNSTTLHLVTAWDSNNMLTKDGKTPVVIYSNAPRVELYRNGTPVGTAIRTVHTTEAGHTYYTYDVFSSDTGICTAVQGSGSGSLYATFDVAYEEGTISAKAYDGNNQEITETKGTKSVSTPGKGSRLRISQDKTSIAADGSSLVYITVDVTDENGNLNTTAENTINFSLSGNGEILGVDNGDQATTAKYQQSGVLAGSASAQIAAYAGKALVIARSTKDAGSFTVDVTSDGLNGGSVSVSTYAVGGTAPAEGLVSYTMVKDYTVRIGTVPVLQTIATGTMADGREISGTIEWDEIPEDVYQTAGDYTIGGVLTFEGEKPINVTARLHVIADVIALRNISAVTTPGTAPALPDTVSGVLADGTLSSEFRVAWEPMSGEQFASVGDVVTVNGTAEIVGSDTLTVTASVRVAEAVNTESKNVAPDASGLVQDIPENKQSDDLESIVNGNKTFQDNTSERWTNWNNRTTSAQAALTFSWDTAQLLSSVNLYYYYDSCSAYPESILFEYSLNGTDFAEIGYSEEQTDTNTLGAAYAYTFDNIINPVALRITFTQQGGTSGSHCVGLLEAEIMTFAGTLETNSSAALSSILVDGAAIDGFDADSLTYEAGGSEVTAESAVNAGITVLPVWQDAVRILTVSEDGSDARMYTVSLSGKTECEHKNTEMRDGKEASCTEEGYTGDIFCTDCGKLIEKGEVIPAAGHSYDGGVVTKEPTTQEEGIKTYTCSICGETEDEVIPKLEEVVEKSAPSVTLSAQPAEDGKITLIGQFEDYENADAYYEVTAHGFVYLSSSKLGTRNLTVNTAGRTNVSVQSYREDGSYSYSMTPAFASTYYTVRAYLAYTDETGRTIYVYTNPIKVSYNSLK